MLYKDSVNKIHNQFHKNQDQLKQFNQEVPRTANSHPTGVNNGLLFETDWINLPVIGGIGIDLLSWWVAEYQSTDPSVLPVAITTGENIETSYPSTDATNCYRQYGISSNYQLPFTVDSSMILDCNVVIDFSGSDMSLNIFTYSNTRLYYQSTGTVGHILDEGGGVIGYFVAINAGVAVGTQVLNPTGFKYTLSGDTINYSISLLQTGGAEIGTISNVKGYYMYGSSSISFPNLSLDKQVGWESSPTVDINPRTYTFYAPNLVNIKYKLFVRIRQ